MMTTIMTTGNHASQWIHLWIGAQKWLFSISVLVREWEQELRVLRYELDMLVIGRA